MAKKGIKTKATKAAAPKGKAAKAVPQGSLFEAKKRNFGIGGDIQPKRDLGRFVKWPKYIRLQRQHRVLYQRLKVPPSINQFTNTLSKNTATELFKLMDKYRPEDKAAKKERLQAAAAAKADDAKAPAGDKPQVIKYGINHIAALIEKKKASLVVIAHDVDPIEIVVWLPALCRKTGTPYCIVKGKSRLGAVVHQKTATALAFTSVKKEDQAALNKLVEAVNADFAGRAEALRRKWGGGIMGGKTQAALARQAKAAARELAARS